MILPIHILIIPDQIIIFLQDMTQQENNCYKDQISDKLIHFTKQYFINKFEIKFTLMIIMLG